jgi:hypothetical protein
VSQWWKSDGRRSRQPWQNSPLVIKLVDSHGLWILWSPASQILHEPHICSTAMQGGQWGVAHAAGAAKLRMLQMPVFISAAIVYVLRDLFGFRQSFCGSRAHQLFSTLAPPARPSQPTAASLQQPGRRQNRPKASAWLTSSARWALASGSPQYTTVLMRCSTRGSALASTPSLDAAVNTMDDSAMGRGGVGGGGGWGWGGWVGGWGGGWG